MTPKSFSVRIYLQDGHADGVKIISKSKWSGRGLIIPRSSLSEEWEREELNAPGVYVLADLDNAPISNVFIGGADPVCRDLQDHVVQTDFWTSAIIFTSKEDCLSLAQAKYIEARLLQRIQEARKSKIMNPYISQQPELSDAELTDAELFMEHMLGLYPLFGLNDLKN
jgi:hypothetical protein